MKKNIFEGAKFGDKFVTRDGRQAIYITSLNVYQELGIIHDLVTENATLITVIDDGFIDYKEHEEQADDIVSKYQEPIDEEKLEELARKYVLTMSGTMGYYHDIQKIPEGLQVCIDMFKTGYRKANGEL